MRLNRVAATLRSAIANTRTRRWATQLVVVTVGVVACAPLIQPATTPTTTSTPPRAAAGPAQPWPVLNTAQPRLASDPARLADELVADEWVLHDPSSPQPALVAAARRQQVAYRALGRHPEWDPLARPRIPRWLLDIYDRQVEARRELTAISKGQAQAMLPAWHIAPPRPTDELLGYYREAESATGVGWNYLAAINLVETAFGRIFGVSSAGAQGPMQFLPSTFALYGGGGDITSPHDSIMAAGRYLAANGFKNNRDSALYRYNNSNQYVRAVDQYATVMAANPAAFAGCYWWDVYYNATAGDVLLPVGYSATAPIAVVDYLATHPQ